MYIKKINIVSYKSNYNLYKDFEKFNNIYIYIFIAPN